MPKQIKAWECDYCSKYYKSKGNAVKHEKICYNNPATKSCMSCINRSIVDEDGYDAEKGFWYCEEYEATIGHGLAGKCIALKTNCYKWEGR